MGIAEDARRCAVLTKNIQDFLHRTTFFRACVEFSVGIGTSAALAETIVAFGVDLLRFRDECEVFFSVAHVFSAFQNNGTKAEFDEFQRSKKSAWSCPDDNHLRSLGNIGIIDVLKRLVGRHFV